jgi:hypothetical protein
VPQGESIERWSARRSWVTPEAQRRCQTIRRIPHLSFRHWSSPATRRLRTARRAASPIGTLYATRLLGISTPIGVVPAPPTVDVSVDVSLARRLHDAKATDEAMSGHHHLDLFRVPPPISTKIDVPHTSLHFRFFRRRVDRRNDLERLLGL